MADRRQQNLITDVAGAREFLADVVKFPEDAVFGDVLAALTLLDQAGELR